MSRNIYIESHHSVADVIIHVSRPKFVGLTAKTHPPGPLSTGPNLVPIAHCPHRSADVEGDGATDIGQHSPEVVCESLSLLLRSHVRHVHRHTHHVLPAHQTHSQGRSQGLPRNLSGPLAHSEDGGSGIQQTSDLHSDDVLYRLERVPTVTGTDHPGIWLPFKVWASYKSLVLPLKILAFVTAKYKVGSKYKSFMHLGKWLGTYNGKQGDYRKNSGPSLYFSTYSTARSRTRQTSSK